MLAEAMVRLSRGKPTRRYALDPVHQQAIQNYLSLLTRGYGMPQLHRQAQHAIRGMGEVDGPLFNRLMTAMFQGDESAPGAALDLLREGEHPVTSPQDRQSETDPWSDLIYHLAQSHQDLSGGLDIPGMFHPGRMRETPVARTIASRYTNNGGPLLPELSDMLYRLRSSPGGAEAGTVPNGLHRDYFMARHALRNSGNGADSLPRVHDSIDRIAESGIVGNSAVRARTAHANLMRDVLHHLTGRAPLEGNNG